MKAVAIDIETTGLGWDAQVLTISVASGTTEEAVQSFAYNISLPGLFVPPLQIPEAAAALRNHLQDAEWVVFHNASFDLPYLFRCGILLPEQVWGRIFDTLVMSRSTGPHISVSLSNLCAVYHIGNEEWRSQKSKRSKLARMDPETVLAYAASDAENTLRLFFRVYPLAIGMYTKDWISEDGNYSIVIAAMRQNGIALDLQRIQEIREEKTEEYVELLKSTLAPNQIRGPNDRRGVLAYLGSCGEALSVTAAGNPQLDQAAIDMLLNANLSESTAAVLRAISRARHLQKEIGTWLTGMEEAADGVGRVHPSFFVGGTVSSRLSCSHPNTQAVPKELYGQLFVAGTPRGALISSDYSQAELRLAAIYAGETTMAEIFSDRTNDIHLATARVMFGDEKAAENRQLAKRVNFGSIYGAGARVISEETGISIEAAAALLKQHRKSFPKLFATSKRVEERWKSRGYLVLAGGRRLYATPDDLAFKSYKAYNQLIQGGVAGILAAATIKVYKAGLKIVNQVHDQIDVEVAPEDDADAVAHFMQETMRGAVPVELLGSTNPPIMLEADCEIKRRESERT